MFTSIGIMEKEIGSVATCIDKTQDGAVLPD